ncbi:MAG TPA: mannonate dehydratase [Aggregatilinea sp.]|uniref:mannonate dehydratase n=1 Tax=Aggregatilinea sp. TaxID=2806333 RepID=UPI002B80D8CA|nr:mannonate dehydratase [Aggregatilinea sp.]HML24295.1 mannonate dehydratase [Aggregatilinea sp.]
MQLGLGLYRHMLTPDNFRFARQAGATAIVAHLCDYFAEGPRIPTTRDDGWGVAGTGLDSWQPENLAALKASVEAEGLQLAAVENLDPMLWHDVLLDGPRKAEQLETVKDIIRRFGDVGIPVLGYNFSLAGVWGHVEGPYARGGATSVGFLGADGPQETQIPRGMVWNMIYDAEAGPGTIGTVTQEQLWARLKDFLDAVLPVAEEAGVRIALHPDDPPMPTLRDTARLVYQPRIYQQVLDLHPSPSNTLEFCIGSLAEMTEGDIYDVVDTYTRQNDVAYIHFRNIRGKVPRYHEVFVDEGDVNMIRVIRILLQNRFEGVIIPDHTPQMTCDAPWHAGMAFALGYIRAAIQACS